MEKELIRIAMAVNNEGHFQPKHFGEADKYLIYEWKDDELIYSHEVINPFKYIDEKQKHGVRKKGISITVLLKNHKVKLIVSKQFGKNIQIVNHDFIPVIIFVETPDEAKLLLIKHKNWILEELNNSAETYKLFILKDGTIKTII
jgi:predicted Fe-Mo cluster-binding NifX family protein